MDNTAHHQQKSDSEKHREVCAACVSSKFEPSTKKINGHGQDFISLSSYKRENIKLMVVKQVDKGKDDTPFYYMAESHLGKSSHEEQRGLKCAGHSKQQNDSEQHQEMCAASESVEIYISTKEGISKLGKVCRDLYDSCKPMNKIEEKKVKLTMQTWNFNIEPHLDRSSNAEQKSFHDIDDTAHRQQKGDSEQLQEMCAASESVEINAITQKGISELGKESHVGGSSDTEQKRLLIWMIWMILHIASKRI
ncbi:uncharacterized protein LOC144377833 [Ictidomys tridecemlineatus]